MPSPSVTYTFSNSTTADATQVNQNFTDLINGLTDGTKDLSVSALTCAGNVAFNGTVTLGNASGDDITVTGSLASSVAIKTTNSYNVGSVTKGLQYIYFGSSSGSNTTRLVGSAVSADVQLILPGASGTLRLVGDTQAKTTTYTALNTDGIIKCDTSGGAWTLTLPAASGNGGLELLIVKTTSDANAVTVDANGAETINGATTTLVSSQYESLKIRCDGSAWFIIDRSGYAGQVLQSTSTQTATRTVCSTAIPYDSTVPQNTEGVEIFTAAITPRATTNKIRITAVIQASYNASMLGTVALFQDSTAGALATAMGGATAANYMNPVTLIYEMTAGTVSATTFKIRVGPQAGGGSVIVNGYTAGDLGSTLVSSLIVEEIKV